MTGMKGTRWRTRGEAECGIRNAQSIHGLCGLPTPHSDRDASAFRARRGEASFGMRAAANLAAAGNGGSG